MREFELLNHIYDANSRLTTRVIVPPGDDLAVITLDNGSQLLAGVDQLIEGRHFNSEDTTWRDVGRKAVARSLSDIAAMAAQPLAALATGVFPPGFPQADATQLCDGMRECALQYRCPIIGGDIASGHGPVVCAITVLAQPGPTGKIITRSGAKRDDAIYVTGRLGGAWRTNRHLNFEPRIALALALVEKFDIHSMIDLSDGLGRDLDHIAELSGLAAIIDAELVPCHDHGDWKRAMSDGEDYELCFTAARDRSIPNELLGIPITRIGMMHTFNESDLSRTMVETPDGERIDASTFGWEHGAHE
jgi:thiamine-monophosphate kinase